MILSLALMGYLLRTPGKGGTFSDPLSPGRPIKLASNSRGMQCRICLPASAAIFAGTLPFLLVPQTSQTCCFRVPKKAAVFYWTTSLLTSPHTHTHTNARTHTHVHAHAHTDAHTHTHSRLPHPTPVVYQVKSLQLVIHLLHVAHFLGTTSHSGAGQSVPLVCRLEATVQIPTSSFSVSLTQITWSPRTPLLRGKYSLPFPTPPLPRHRARLGH